MRSGGVFPKRTCLRLFVFPFSSDGVRGLGRMPGAIGILFRPHNSEEVCGS